MNKIITISRQYGSGGREIGAKLAAKYGIPFYDNEIITRAAKESGYAEAAFHNAETKATNSLLYSIAMGMSAYGNQEIGFSQLSLDDRIYLAQSDVIRKVAEEGPCVVVGRCADYILKEVPNVINIFIHADMDFRKERAVRVNNVAPAKAEDMVLKMDMLFHTLAKIFRTILAYHTIFVCIPNFGDSQTMGMVYGYTKLRQYMAYYFILVMYHLLGTYPYIHCILSPNQCSDISCS